MGHGKDIQISCDGMSESKSSNISLDVYSSKFLYCKSIFPHKIVRPLRKYPIDNLVQFSEFLDDLTENDMRIKQYIADNLKRATGKNCLNHAASFPCEYCFSRAVRFQPKVSGKNRRKQFKKIRQKLRNLTENDSDFEELEKELEETENNMNIKKKSHLVWPSSTMNGEPRTTEKIREIVERLESGERLQPEESKGVVGRSPLMNLPGFDMVRDSPTEYLHSVCLGTTKRMLILTFSVGETRTRVTKRKLSSPVTFNNLMQLVKFVREFNRRNRELDLSVMKGQELRNVVIFYFQLS